jgi:hypothetical protein
MVRDLNKEASEYLKAWEHVRHPRPESLAVRIQTAKAPNEAARLAAWKKRRDKSKRKGS